MHYNIIRRAKIFHIGIYKKSKPLIINLMINSYIWNVLGVIGTVTLISWIIMVAFFLKMTISDRTKNQKTIASENPSEGCRDMAN